MLGLNTIPGLGHSQGPNNQDTRSRSEILDTENCTDPKSYSKGIKNVIDDINTLQRRFEYRNNNNNNKNTEIAEIIESKAGYRTNEVG